MTKVKQINFETLEVARVMTKVPMRLSDEERTKTANELADTVRGLLTLRSTRTKQVKEINEEIKELEEQQQRLLGEHEAGQREVNMVAEVGYDWKAKRKYIKHPDTGEIIGPIPVSEDDEQKTLPINGDPNGATEVDA